MSSVSDNLFGAYTHKLDPKNRIAIPAEWRPTEGCAQRHQLSGMAVNEQVHAEAGGVQRIQQPQQSAFRAPQLHVLNGYEYTFHLHASVRMWPISPRKGDVLNSTSTSSPSGMTTEIMPHMNRSARGEEK